MTAFMLSREAHPSGQFKRPFLTYFSPCRLHKRNNKTHSLSNPLAWLKAYDTGMDQGLQHTQPS